MCSGRLRDKKEETASNGQNAPAKAESDTDSPAYARESYRILKDNAHAYFFIRFDCYLYHYQCLRQAGFAIKNCMVVEKWTVGGIGDLKGSFANNAEWIIFCQKGRRIFNHTTLLQNRKKEGTKFHVGREPSKKYKTMILLAVFMRTRQRGYLRKSVS